MNAEPVFNGGKPFILRCEVGEHIGTAVDVERSAFKQGIPQRMNKTGTQEFQCPVTRIIGMPQLNALKQ
jgi:hypothetical protein